MSLNMELDVCEVDPQPHLDLVLLNEPGPWSPDPLRPDMAESCRVQLSTLSSEDPLSCQTLGPDPSPPPCDPDPDRGSVRLVLTLFDPDERTFPEFSYSQLIEDQIKQKVKDVPLSRFEEEQKENAEMAAIAQNLEEKYGGKHKKKDRIQDLIDIGYGYDEEDSFIDNSEAYDEFVPASITTKFGGFYVNCGVLQFRQASDTETDNQSIEGQTLKPSKKRKLNDRREKPKTKHFSKGAMKTDVDSKASGLSEPVVNEMRKKKKKKAASTLSVTSMLKKFQREKERERGKTEKANQRGLGTPTIPLGPADAAGSGALGFTDPLQHLIGSTSDHALIQAASAADFDIDLDSLLAVSEDSSSSSAAQTSDMQPVRSKTDSQAQVKVAPAQSQPHTKTSLQQKVNSEKMQELESSPTPPHQCDLFPERLTSGLEGSIRKLMAATKTSEGDSKVKFYTPEINSMLLDIELQSRGLGAQLHSTVYTQLASVLPCSEETLHKRVKKLLLTHLEPPDADAPMRKLKEAIGKVMPKQIECYQENCQVYEQVKAPKVNEDDDVEDKGGKKARVPRKSFKWNEEIRECLSNILRLKMDWYKKERTGSQDVEEYLKTVLNNEIKPLWPKGWMQSGILIKESRKILGLFTSVPVKKSEKKQPSASPSTSDVLQGNPPLKGGLSHEAEVSSVCTTPSLGALTKMDSKAVEGSTGSPTPAEIDTPLVWTTSAQSPLDLLADHALAQEHPLLVSQELLAAAVAMYRHSAKPWSVPMDTRSPPLPPPPPQSSPVNFPFPMNTACQVVGPRLQHISDPGQMKMNSCADGTIQ